MTTTIHESVARLMSTPVASLGLDATMSAIAEVLASNEIGAVVVLAADRPVGIVTERDIVSHVAAGANPEHLTAGDMLSTALITVGPGEDVLDAAALMVDAAVRHLPVVDDEGDVVGMLSARDVMAALMRSWEGG